MRHKVHLEVKELQELLLAVHDLLNSHGVVCNLLGHDLGVEGEDILELAGKIHADDSDLMHVFISIGLPYLMTGY